MNFPYILEYTDFMCLEYFITSSLLWIKLALPFGKVYDGHVFKSYPVSSVCGVAKSISSVFSWAIPHSGRLFTIHCNPLTNVAIWDSFRSACFRLSIECVMVLCILSTNPMSSLDSGLLENEVSAK